MEKKTVIVTGLRAPATLDLVRQLGRECRVIGCDSVRFPVGRSSKAIFRYYRLPSAVRHPELFVQQLEKIARWEKADLLVPTCEEIFWVSRFRDRLEKTVSVFCEDDEVLEKLHDKYQFFRLAKDLGIQTPRTILWRNKKAHELERCGFERFVIKPTHSRFATETLILPSEKEIEKLIDARDERRAYICQEFVAGHQQCTFSVARNGRLLAHATYQTIYAAGSGATIQFEAIENVDSLTAVEKVVRHLNFTGQIACDFIVNDAGETFMIECNPRLTSGVHLLTEKAVSQAYLWENVAKNPLENRPSMLALPMLLYGFPAVLQGSMQFLPWMKSFFQSRDVVFRLNDLRPFFAQFASLAELVFIAIRERKGILRASTADIEWNGVENDAGTS